MGKKEYIYGKNTVMESLKAGKGEKIYVAESFHDDFLFSLAKKKNIEIKKVTKEVLEQYVGKVNHQGIILEVQRFEYEAFQNTLRRLKEKEDALILVLDGLEDPQNFGAILRSADAFGVDSVLIPKMRSVAVTPVVRKVSTGASEYVPVSIVSNLHQTIEVLKEQNFWVVASDGNAKTSFDAVDYKRKIVLIIGSEGKGISPLLLKSADYVTKIPMLGHVNSLNASVATGIYLSQIQRDRRGKNGQ